MILTDSNCTSQLVNGNPAKYAIFYNSILHKVLCSIFVNINVTSTDLLFNYPFGLQGN